MPETRFTAFISCSFADEDKEIIDFFRKMISAFTIDPFTYDYQEVARVSEKLKEHIMASDCLIAIATRRNKIEGTPHWACPDWIQHEVALAHAYGKPIAIFVEDGVKIEGLIALEERRERFDRQKMLANVDKIAKFLFGLRTYLESSRESNVGPLLLRHYIHEHEQMLSRELTVVRTEVLMESLVATLEASHHSIEVEETTPGLSVRALEFDFKCLERPADVRAEPLIVLNTDARFFWKIIFAPPLKSGQRVKYAFKVRYANYRPYSRAELLERISRGTYEYKEAICEGCEWTIVYPTYELQHAFEVPENYEIERAFPDVVIGEAKIKAETELRRLKEGNMFKAEKLFDKWVLKLQVPKPLLNHTYYTYYVPAQ